MRDKGRRKRKFRLLLSDDGRFNAKKERCYPQSGEIQSSDRKTSAMKGAKSLEILLQSTDIGAPFVKKRHDIVRKR